MKNNKFILGISPRFFKGETQDYIRVSMQYINAVKGYNHVVPLIITDTTNLDDLLSICDAYLCIGGDDLNPTIYNENNDLGLSKEINPLTDEIDKKIIEDAINFNKPFLGICRGIQSLAAFTGGSLHQDLSYDNVYHPLIETHLHSVAKVNNFGVAALLPDNFKVNSYHHQAVKDVPEGYIVLFKNGDTIEAIQSLTKPILGVQWHPERFYTEESKIIFDYFMGLIK